MMVMDEVLLNLFYFNCFLTNVNCAYNDLIFYMLIVSEC